MDQNYDRKWMQHEIRMNTGRIPEQILYYQRRGQGPIRHPVKRWEESVSLLQATWPNI